MTKWKKFPFGLIMESKTSLAFSEITGESSIPKRKLNGGLYTGEPFKEGAKWANVPIIPESHIHMQGQFKLAEHHIPGGVRLGNNKTSFPMHKNYNKEIYPNIYCASGASPSKEIPIGYSKDY